MIHVLFFTIVIIWCVIFARLEIEIEGKNGWAENLPTSRYWLDGLGRLWHKSLGSDCKDIIYDGWKYKFIVFWIRKMLGGREFTGYHRVVDIMQLFVGHLVAYMLFFQTAPWWVIELRVLAFIWLSWSIEDTLWFVLNPFYGLKKYKPEFISWHADDWWKFAPKGMIMLFSQGLVLYALTLITGR